MNDDREGLRDLLDGAFGTVLVAARPGAPVYVAYADMARSDFEGAFTGAGLLLRQNLIWVKNIMVIGRADYHWKHEPILFGEVPDFDPAAVAAAEAEAIESREVNPGAPFGDRHEPILYGFTPGGTGRLGRGGPAWFGDNKQTTVLEFSKPSRNVEHPTMKPVDLVLHMLKNSCPQQGVVLDLFGGSGSTLIAAHHRGARARLVELDPKYVDVICRRWQQHTGVKPKRDGVEVDFCGGA
ncbi:hypothetical protein CPHO_07140 [Corynebacterium phocae]|uniref:Methyltransferase n=1 Tax=Corynebacterium phocae TaxID=161895 RepID=A0A1L7D444_9CORY|nr:DNA methyltransferase [Corynebacterium phocae]APT92702.1 hypothetical protein CPHO_07140 [Corynebacterium phocae]